MITQQRLKEVIHYNHETGVFTWIKNINSRAKNGCPAGYKAKSGYIRIRIDSTEYYAHRLACLYINGYFPENDIDHLFCMLRTTFKRRKTMDKKDKILKHLKTNGSITPKQAYSLYGHMRLASVVHRFKEEGHNITTKMCSGIGKGGENVRFAKYIFTKPGKSQPRLF